MREKMRKEHGNRNTALFHLKQDKGGIVDIEFLVQYLVLLNANRLPEITKWTDNVRLLLIMSENGIIDKESANTLKETYLTLRSKIHKLSLQEMPPLVPVDEFVEKRKKVVEIQKKYMGP